MTSILDPLVNRQGGTLRSVGWYRNAVNSMSGRVTAGGLMRSGKLTGKPNVGLLNMFFY